MSGAGSAKGLLLRVLLLAGLLVGLSRLAGRLGAPGPGQDDSLRPQATAAEAPAEELSNPVPDLSFYRTLGKKPGPSGTGGAPGGAAGPPTNNNDAEPGSVSAPARADQGAFLVQALATKDARAADRLRDRLAGRGFPASVIEDRTGDRPVYRVRVGRYRTRAEAEAVVRVLRQKDHVSPWILQEGE